jgi:hypothetical protein
MMALAPPGSAQSAPPSAAMMEQPQMAVDLGAERGIRRKRKAESSPGNERLSKRLSLLNLGTKPFAVTRSALAAHRLKRTELTQQGTEKDGSKLYVPVEQPVAPPSTPVSHEVSRSLPTPSQSAPRLPAIPEAADAAMQIDANDDKHKVYIYNLDDELSSESETEDGKLVFLPDIDKHLRSRRVGVSPSIPPPIAPNSEGELAGMQLVLYNVPSSISVPEEQDGVRRAIIEARARLRDKQRDDDSHADEERNAPALERSPMSHLAPVPGPLQDSTWLANAADPDAMDLS